MPTSETCGACRFFVCDKDWSTICSKSRTLAYEDDTACPRFTKSDDVMSKGDTYMDDNGVVWTEFSDGQKVILFDTVGERRCVSEYGSSVRPYRRELRDAMPDVDKILLVNTALFAVLSIALLAVAYTCA